MPHTPRRWALREQTTTLHDAVDDAVGSFSTLCEYGRYLRHMTAFRLPVERSLRDAAWPDAFADWRPTVIAGSIEQDLADLGLDMPPLEALEGPRDTDELMGVSYVLQGSSLGAQVLLKRAEALGLSSDFGARHLAAQANGAARWRHYLDLLESAEGLDMDRVVQASSATFQQAKSAFAGDVVPA